MCPPYQEPIPLWQNKLQLASLTGLAMMLGCMRTTKRTNAKIHMVFGDFVINSTLAIIWHQLTQTVSKKAKIFNFKHQFLYKNGSKTIQLSY